MAKTRSHNEWFRTVSLGGRKTCPCCRERLEPGESIWSWGQYVHGIWRTVKHFCKNCYEKGVREQLIDHADDCGCEINLVGRHGPLPEWLTLEENCPTRKAA